MLHHQMNKKDVIKIHVSGTESLGFQIIDSNNTSIELYILTAGEMQRLGFLSLTKDEVNKYERIGLFENCSQYSMKEN